MRVFASLPLRCNENGRKLQKHLNPMYPEYSVSWMGKTFVCKDLPNFRMPFITVNVHLLLIRVYRSPLRANSRVCDTGWLHSVFATGVLLFGVDGTILWCRHNCPGSWNDGDVSFKLQEKLQDPRAVFEGGRVCADSAFPVSSGLQGKLITPLKDGDLERWPASCRLGLTIMSNAITSLRQCAEWGMGAVDKVYRILQLRLPVDEVIRARRLENIFRLYNFRVRRTGISEIRTFFFG
jgi:hypothetical protein